jgi:O-acetyl-ADP-ribose deacetylase (regulator of RNase III)
MYEFKNGDIFQSNCTAIVNAVNCIGVMGAGLALAFKRRYPAMNKDYIAVCKRRELRPGTMHVWGNPEPNPSLNQPRFIINFPTKDDLSPSKIEYIVDGLEALKKVILDKNIDSIAVPALGSGLGKLSWSVVKTHIEDFAKSLPRDVKVLIYEPL